MVLPVQRARKAKREEWEKEVIRYSYAVFFVKCTIVQVKRKNILRSSFADRFDSLQKHHKNITYTKAVN